MGESERGDAGDERVCSLGDLPIGGRKHVMHRGEELTLLRRNDGDVTAVVTRCPHQGGRLGDGAIQGDALVCPLHRWRFDLKTGATARDRRLRATLRPVRVEGEDVLVTGEDP